MKKKKRFEPIGRTLLIKILIASGLVTTLVTAVSFYLDYTTELSTLENTFTQIKRSSSHAVTQAAWNENDEVLKSQLNGILKINDIVEVYIINEESDKVFNYKKDIPSTYLDSRNFNLIFHNKYDGSQNNLGQLHVIAAKDNMYQRLIQKVLYVFTSQLFKTLIVSAVLLGIFKDEVTIHIKNIMDYFQSKDLTNIHIGGNLQSPYNRTRINEFDKLNDSINIMTKIVAQNNIDKDRELERQKTNSINSARLAALGEMASGIAHEINNPLTVITLAAKSMEKKVTKTDLKTETKQEPDVKSDADKYSSFLSIINESSFRIQKIIESMKRQARDGDKDEFELITVKTLLSDVLDLSEAKFKQANIEIKMIIDMELEFECRRIQLSQVLINLFNNAFDAIHDTESPWVELRVEKLAEDIVITFTDSGPGIPTELQQKILQPFYTTKAVGKGTGLGLSISCNVIEDHGGSLYIDSEFENTRFILTFPKNQMQQVS